MFKLKEGDAVYSADAVADTYVNGTDKGFLFEKANPNISYTGFVVFETTKKSIEIVYELNVFGGVFSAKSAAIDLTN